MTRQVVITDFLTDEQIAKAQELFRSVPDYEFARRCAETIIFPNLITINQKLGQANNAMYLAYAVQYVLTQASKR